MSPTTEGRLLPSTIAVMRKFTIGLFGAALLYSQTSTWRPVYLGMDAMVATAHYATAMAGYRILVQGGNAVDAAAAACFASTVVEPSRSGIGGDAFILIYLAKTKQVLFVNGGGWAPKRATVEFYQSKGGLDLDGPLSPVVPGAPAALLLAVEKFGKLKREQVLAPAIELAERGFVVSENLQNVLRLNVTRLLAFPSSAFWFRGEQPLRMGDVVIRKNLGHTLRRIAALGRDGFYKGPTAENLVAFLGRNGGIMDASDLAEFAAEEAKPLHIRYRGYDVYGVGLPTQSPVMLEALKILEGFDLKGMGHNSADYIHYVVEALKLAFADREAHIGDPRFVKNIPIETLLSDEYAARRRSAIRKGRAIDGVAQPGLVAVSAPPRYVAGRGSDVELHGAAAFPDWIESFTTHIDAVDKDRNMVTITSSVASNFGSAMYVDGEYGGYFLNDILARFHLDALHPNGIAPHKRPRQTLNPVLVLKDGKPLMVFGSPGGDTQGQSQLQFFLNWVEFGMNVQQALEQPYFATGAYQISFHPHMPGKGLSVSQRIPREVRDELAKRGHTVRTHSAKGVGSVKAIVVDTRSGVLMGGAAPATDAYVIGW